MSLPPIKSITGSPEQLAEFHRQMSGAARSDYLRGFRRAIELLRGEEAALFYLKDDSLGGLSPKEFADWLEEQQRKENV